MIIGLTGSLAAGKGVVSNFLKEECFVYLSLSDELREVAKEKKIELTRKNLQDLGNQLRQEQGGSVLAKLESEKIQNQQYAKAIVDGIRNPAEVYQLMELEDFYLISVDAPQEARFKRLVSRNRESDPKTLEDFLKVDQRDKGIGEQKHGQNVGQCMELANYNLINDGSLEDAQKKVKSLYNKIKLSIPRPSWDKYFMKMAVLVAERSTCLRHHVGTVIVKDKKALTTGYNGAAKGVKHCLEGGCIREKLNIPSGEKHEKCKGIHAEQNAIVQAAHYGISIKDSTMYSTHAPCIICAKMIVNAGIKEVIYYNLYPNQDSIELFEEAKVKLTRIKRPKSIIEFKD